MTRLVVGAAITRRGTILAAQRGHPPELAGRWELPGGKVEPGESDVEALVRECREELGCHIVVGDRIGPDLPTADGEFILHCYLAELTPTSPLPRSGEHSALRWVSAEQVGRLDWLDADLPLVGHLEAWLRGEALPLSAGVTDLDAFDDGDEPRRTRPRRHLVRPLNPLVAVVTGALVALGLGQSAVLASGAAEPDRPADQQQRLQQALFPPPSPDLDRTLSLIPAGLLPSPTTCRPSGLLAGGAVVVEGSYGSADQAVTDVVLLHYPSVAKAEASVQGVIRQIRTTCRTLRPTALDGGSVAASYDAPLAVKGKGYEITYSGQGTLRDSGSGTTGDLEYLVRGDVALFRQGADVVEVADGDTTYGFNDTVDAPARKPVPLATVLLERLRHP